MTAIAAVVVSLFVQTLISAMWYSPSVCGWPWLRGQRAMRGDERWPHHAVSSSMLMLGTLFSIGRHLVLAAIITLVAPTTALECARLVLALATLHAVSVAHHAPFEATPWAVVGVNVSLQAVLYSVCSLVHMFIQ